MVLKILLILTMKAIFIVLMIKSYIKYFTILCIFLLSINGQLDANIHKINPSDHSKINLSTFSNKNVDNQQRNVNVTFVVASFDNNQTTLFDFDEEIEEDEEESIISQKKNLENTNFSSALFCSWCSKFSLLNNTQVLHFGKHFSHFSYHKLFIVFQVFRI